MVDKQLCGDGAVVYWTIESFTDRPRLKAGWDALGLGKFVPELRPNVSCLKDALTEVCGGSRFLVRPLGKRDGFTVVAEDRGEDENAYRHVLTAKIFSENTEPVFTGDQTRAQEVLEAYRKHTGRVQAQQMGGALVSIMNHLGGTRLRPSGGVYWTRGSRLAEWTEAMEVAEKASENGRTTGFAIRHDMDEASIKAVQSAIIHEVSVEAHRLAEEIGSGELGDRAIKTRKAEAAALRDKVSEYESFLGVSLESLRKTLDSVEQTNAIAALLLSAAPLSFEEEVSHVSA